jgi:antitoxin MazE
MRTTIRRWGNSAALRIPAAVMRVVRISADQPVDIRLERGRIFIELILDDGVSSVDLNALLAGVTDENRPDPADFGPAIGKEVW